MRKPIAGLVALALCAARAEATTVVRLGDEELARRASRVVEGKVRSAVGERDARGRIVTRVRIAVAEGGWWKGSGGAEVEVCVPGGVLPAEGAALVVPGMPRLQAGEEVVLFLAESSTPGGLAVPVGLGQGKWNLVRDAGGVALGLERDLSGLSFVDANGRSVPPPRGGTRRIPREELRERVRRAIAGR